MKVTPPRNLQHRVLPLEMESEEFRRLGYTSLEDIKALPPIVARIGREIDSAIRPEEL
jgi:hypothetical protein